MTRGKMLSAFVRQSLALLLMTSTRVKADMLFRDTTIATWDDSTQVVQVLRNTSILIEDDRITRIFSFTDAVPDTNNTLEIIDAHDKIIVPGFISTHHHMWQTIYKTLRSNTSFADYVPRLSEFAPLSATLTPDEVYRSQLMGALEMMSEGVTAWIDCHGAFSDETTDAAVQATLDSGGRGFFGANVHDIPDYTQEDQLAHIWEVLENPRLLNQSLVKVGLSYDGFQTATPQVHDGLLDIINSGNLNFITTHYVGGPWGFYNSPELLNSSRWGLLNGSLPVVFSHSSYLSPLDAALLREHNQYISTTPESELHFGHGNPQVHRIQDQASLGGDTQFPYSTSLVTQARMWLQQLRGRLMQREVENWVIPGNNPMSVSQALYLGTRAGALALRRPDLGIVAEGATADLVVVDTNRPNLVGWRDPVAAVILHSNPGDISDVVVGGNFVKRNFKTTFERWADFRGEFEQSARDVEQRWLELEHTGDPGSVFPLGTLGLALEVDVVRGDATGY